jgi:small subunit ribosomal protein S21
MGAARFRNPLNWPKYGKRRVDQRQNVEPNIFLDVPDFSGERNTLAEIRLQEGEPLENALRRFKRKVQAEDIIKEVKRHSFYLKPGEKRRVKQALARKRAKKKIRKDRDSRPERD